MIKNQYSSAIINYGPELPVGANTPDGALFFKTAEPFSGLYVYNFTQDLSSVLSGDQSGQNWNLLVSTSSSGTFVPVAGGSMIGSLNVGGFSGVGGVSINRNTASGSNPGIINFTTGAGATTGSIGWVEAASQLRLTGSWVFATTPTVTGSTIFHAGNDGAGSGLDADLLDGQQGLFYQNAGNLNAGLVALARGGGNVDFSTGADGGVIYKTPAALATTPAGTATSGSGTAQNWQVLTSGGAGAPAWVNSTSLNVAYATTAGTALSVGTATTANTLTPGRTIGISGGATGTATLFDGSANISIPITGIDASSLNSGTVPNARISGAYTNITNITMSGNLSLNNGGTGDLRIQIAGTVDGADTGRLILDSTNSTTPGRGAYMILSGNEAGSGPGRITLQSGDTGGITLGGGTIGTTVNGSGGFTVSAGTITGNGSGITTLNLGQASNTGTVAVARGGTGLSTVSANQLLGGNSGGTALEYKQLVQGTGVTITHSAGTITISAPENGTVTDVSIPTATGISFVKSTTGGAITLTPSLSTELAGLVEPTATGLVTRTGTGTYEERTLTWIGSGLSINNANGVSGNPQIVLASATANTASTLVFRDSSGNFSANTVTVNTLSGTAVNASSSIASSGTIISASGSALLPSYSFSGDTNTGMYSDNADTIRWTTGGTLAMSLGPTGNLTTVGAITTQRVRVGDGDAATPTISFESDPNTGIYCQSVNSNHLCFSAGGTERGYFNSSGLSVNGSIVASNNVTAFGTYTAFSDARVKTNVETIDAALDKVKAIRGVTYDRTDMPSLGRQMGVIAQEIEEVLPEVVTTHDDGMKSVAYGNMVGLLIEAVKVLAARVEQLEAERQS